jgi:hypothetical protein
MNKDFSILKSDFDSKIFKFFGKNKWQEKKSKWQPKIKMASGGLFFQQEFNLNTT